MSWLDEEWKHQHLVDGIIMNLNRLPQCDDDTNRLSAFAGVLNVLLNNLYQGCFDIRIDQTPALVDCSEYVWKPIKKITEDRTEQYYLAHLVAERLLQSLRISAAHMYLRQRLSEGVEDD
jgi:hypothetical protein